MRGTPDLPQSRFVHWSWSSGLEIFEGEPALPYYPFPFQQALVYVSDVQLARQFDVLIRPPSNSAAFNFKVVAAFSSHDAPTTVLDQYFSGDPHYGDMWCVELPAKKYRLHRPIVEFNHNDQFRSQHAYENEKFWDSPFVC
jgi:hypothetical protein